MKKKLSNVLLSTATLVLTAGIMIGASYSLFTDNVQVNNHLQAGSLKVGLNRISFQEKVLKDDGTLIESAPNTDVIDLTLDNSTLFTFVNAVPTSWEKATIEVSNLGNVAFDYGVRMIFNTDNSATALQVEFAKQIKISITAGTDINESFLLNDAKDHSIGLGSVLANSSAQTFDVKAEFLDLENNNSVQTLTLDFDMQVYATQKIN